MITKEFDTIAAISTPLGEGAIGIVRLSGTDALAIAKKVYRGKDLSKVDSHTINYGHIVDPDNDEILDEVMVSVMLSPKTFTREDVIEINTHGGVAVTNEILQLVLRHGARLAEPGEFTKRAFLNGRVDLTQAEAVMDIIRAKTDKAMNIAVKQLDGSLSKLINDTRQEILNTLAQVEVNIDYPEYDDVEEMTTALIREKTQEFQTLLENLLRTARRGKILREGLSTAIIGRPNVGKSSLLNNLLREDKAIVTDIEGTTRDVVDASFNLNGITLNLIDTAGIRDTSETIEREELLINLNCLEKVNDKYMFTNAGVIFFSKNPTKFLIQNYITCIAFKGTNRVYILDTLDCNKDIITNIENALAFAKKHINLTYLINAEVMREQGNATRKEVLEIPEDVLKEAIINRYMSSPVF